MILSVLFHLLNFHFFPWLLNRPKYSYIQKRFHNILLQLLFKQISSYQKIFPRFSQSNRQTNSIKKLHIKTKRTKVEMVKRHQESFLLTAFEHMYQRINSQAFNWIMIWTYRIWNSQYKSLSSSDFKKVAFQEKKNCF